MWFGRIVPLFRFPLTEGIDPLRQASEEDLRLPLPLDLCAGMNTEPGTTLYVTYGINPENNENEANNDVKDKKEKSEKEKSESSWGDDLAGWMVIAPFPPSLFGSERLMRLDVHLKNFPGAFQQGVTDVVTESEGFFLGMEVLGTGDMGSLILLPENSREETVRQKVGEVSRKSVRGVEFRSWKRFRKKSQDGNESPLNPMGGRKQGNWKEDEESSPLGWISSLFPRSGKNSKNKTIDWAPSRRVIVRDRHITVPYGEFWYNFNGTKEVAKFYKANYCLLARDMELPVLLALFPSRPLFRVNLDVAAEKDPADQDANPGVGVGVGVLNSVVKEISSWGINIWHTQNTYKSLIFGKERGSAEEEPSVLRSLEGRISIIASIPKERAGDRPEAITSFLESLRKSLLKLRVKGLGGISKSLEDALGESPVEIGKQIHSNLQGFLERVRKEEEEKGINSLLRQRVDTPAILQEVLRELDRHLEVLAQSLEPSFVKNVGIHGPPLYRCFFSHSASPAYDERGQINRLKLLLESEVFEVIEGEFSLGMSTEALSRGRIRDCDLFISFLWPREEFRTPEGKYLPPEWVTHEESFAIGHGLEVYRIREQSVEPPRYERDRPDFLFLKGDLESSKGMEEQFRQEIQHLVQRKVLGIYPGPSEKIRNKNLAK